MGYLVMGFPLDAVLPMTNSLVGVATTAARPLIGLGIFATLLVIFRPLLSGIVRAAMLVLAPRKSLQERRANAHVKDVMAVHRLARKLENQHPSLAAELRAISSRD
jgi:hypothetical protein